MYKIRSLFKVATILFSTITATVADNNTSFTNTNRFALSNGSLLLANITNKDTFASFWYSNSNLPPKYTSALQFRTKEQSIGVNINTYLGYEQYAYHNLFAVISGVVVYNSPYLNAFVTANAYSTEDRLENPIQDIEFERFIKKNSQEPIEGVFDFRFNLPEAYLQSRIKFLRLEVGKMKLRWGPGYKGTLGLSGTTYSPFFFYNLNLRFGNLLQATAFLCGYEDESYYRDELSFYSSTKVKDTKIDLKSNFPRYGAGQRLDVRIGKHVQIGFYELVDFFGSNELTRFANPLQIYYLSNETSGTNNANLLGGMDFNLIFNRLRFYGEFLNDDITVFENTGNPNKYAFQLGATFYGKGALIQTGIEYTHVTKYVYSHSRVLSRHSFWGESMGWPWGNDQDLFNIHAVFDLPYNIKARTELNYWIKGDGEIENDWFADGKPDLDNAPYWPVNNRKIVSAILAAEYSPVQWISFNFYYEPVLENGKVSNGVYSYLQIGIPGKREFKILDGRFSRNILDF